MNGDSADRRLEDEALSAELVRLNNRDGADDRPALPNEIALSWKRCLDEYNLRPDAVPPTDVLSRGEITELEDKYGELLDVSRTEVDRLFQRLVDNDYLVSLASPEGVMLQFQCDYRALGDMSKIGVLPGSLWTESRQGTNGIGTALLTGKPVLIQHSEHFGVRPKNVTCTTAPILGQHGEIICILNVTTERKGDPRTNAVVLDVVERTSRRIESKYFARVNRKHRLLRLAQDADRGDIADEAQIALDDSGIVLAGSSYLSRLVGLEASDLVGRKLEDTLELERGLDDLLPGQAMSVRLGGKQLQARVELPKGRSGLSVAPPPVTTPQPQPSLLSAAPPLDNSPIDPITSMKLERAERLLASGLPICISGETGVGKTVFARKIAHTVFGPEGDVMFVDCSALKSEAALDIFRQIGRSSKSACIILDNVETLNKDCQSALSGILENDLKVGSCKVNVISVSEASLDQHVKSEDLVPSLAYRLKGASFVLDPLRTRPNFKETLFELLDFEAREQGVDPVKLSPQALVVLEKYHWPGNLRTLRNALRHAIVLCENGLIDLSHLPDEIVDEIAQKDVTARSQSEAMRIESALRYNNGNVSQTARYLGMSRATLYRKIQIQQSRAE